MKYVLYNYLNNDFLKLVGIFETYESALKYYSDNLESFHDVIYIDEVKYIGWYY